MAPKQKVMKARLKLYITFVKVLLLLLIESPTFMPRKMKIDTPKTKENIDDPIITEMSISRHKNKTLKYLINLLLTTKEFSFVY